MTRRTQTVLRVSMILASIALIAILTFLLTVQSSWFREKVRGKIVSVVEDASGGRVEVGAFTYDARTLTAKVTRFVLHGKEAPSEPPLFRAETIEVGLRVVSVLQRRVDLASLNIDKPEISITVGADGRSNLPSPKIRSHSSKSFIQTLLDLKVHRFAMRNGWAAFNFHKVPLNITTENLNARFAYNSQGPRYTGELSSRSLHLDSTNVTDAVFDLQSRLNVDASAIHLEAFSLEQGRSRIDLSGKIDGFPSPVATLDVKANVRPEDLNRPFHVPIANTGAVAFAGKALVHLAPLFELEITGNATGRGLGYHSHYVNVENATLASSVRLNLNGVVAPEFSIGALGGSIRGRLDLEHWKKLSIAGEVRDLSVQAIASLPKPRRSEISGRATGPMHLVGTIAHGAFHDVIASTQVKLAPGESGIPVQGFADITYEQAGNIVKLGNSIVDLGSTHAEVSGIIGQTLTVTHASTNNLNEPLAVLPLVGQPIPANLAITLKGGTARFDGSVAGPLTNPRITGRAEVTKFSTQGQDFDRLAGDFDLTSSRVSGQKVQLSQGPFSLQASGQLGLANWQVTNASPISASISVRGAEIKTILEQRKWSVAATGVLAATAEVKGTLGAPQATAGIDAENVTAYDEHINRVRASLVIAGNTVQVIDGRIQAPAGQLQASGAFEHAANDWTNGQFRFDLRGNGLALAQIAHVQKLRNGVTGQVDVKAHGTAILNKSEFRVQTITSETQISNIAFDGHRYGDAKVTANSHETTLELRADANILNTPVHGSGEWKLEGDDPGRGEITIPRLSVSTLHDLLPHPQAAKLPFDGFIEGKVDIHGPLRKPSELVAEARINSLQINASPAAQPRAGAQPRDLVLRNAEPFMLIATTKGVEIRPARFTATGTTLETQGHFAFDSKSAWDLRVKGSINLAILQIFNPNLLGSGNSVVDAVIRGSATEPQVEGRLELKNASLYVTDLPNGLDQANGVILFDRNRASVDSLSATTGGGQVTIQKGSFVGFRGPALLYRVQAAADHVRYRSPEGVSITVNALLNLIGTSDNSVLSGTVTVIRAGFNPTTDVGGLLANTNKPVSAPSIPNEYLKGMQFDVRVESTQSLEIQTSLTRNIEAEANLRLRGTPERPSVLGNLSVNEGEIEFFGNRYRINRGEVNFYNPNRIEPIIDMDLETAVRGITVDITFSGPLSKLNFSYRSDPPLQTNDIIALLAVGRTPLTSGAIAASQAGGSANYLSTGTSALLSQAISAPVAGRLQRFFGVSHIKIDPQLTDVTSVPQARLTLEQQISKDITLTYITNLTRTQEQIIRVEWDLDRQWSVIALRDENGAFGVDFQYRKRFK